MLGQSQKRGRCEAVNGCWVVTPRTDQQVPVLRLESPAPTLSAKGAEKGGAPRETQVDARRTGVTGLNIQGTGANLHRAGRNLLSVV
jgi:hypothetical protein